MAEETPFRNVSGQSYVQNYDFTPYASIRTLPVQDWVQQAISNAVYAADPSLQIRVQSGGQTASRDPRLKNAPGGWTGSPRHNEGGAADFSLVRNGEKLPVRGNEELYQAVARNLAAQGVPGIGVDVSKGYIHAGGGSQASWGYQGNSASSRYLPQSFAAAINEGRQLYSRGTGIPTPPGEIPNVVASQVDTTPQTRNVPLPKPRPAVRQSAEESVRPYLTSDMQVRGDNLPQLAPAQITPGLGSLTPDFFKTPAPPKRLPDIGSTSSPVGPGPTSLASVQDMYGRPQTNRLDPIGLGPLSLANVQGMYGRGGVGLPPATRSVPSIPVRPAMNAIGTMPSFGQFQAQFGRPEVATQLATARPVIGFPTPVSQRPAQKTIGFPTPANMRPAMAQPQRPPLQVTVQGANSYSAPQPQTFAGTSSGRSYTAGQRYTMGGDTYVANPDGSFTNTRTGRRLAGSSGGQSSQRSSSGPAQSLV